MKTNVGVFFGGRSVEHEISVISALQAINAFDQAKYNIIPIYISKQGRWFTGPLTLDIRNYKDMKSLTERSEEVYMRPEYGDFKLYRANTKGGLFSKKTPSMRNCMWQSPFFMAHMEKMACLKAFLRPLAYLLQGATRCRAQTAWIKSR